jgi:hypothetical protein
LHIALSSADLIEPTRQLKDSAQNSGKLSVFSEPPKLDVYLNSTLMGKTPARLENLKPGVYKLRIGNAETEVYVKPEQAQQISFFKGKFIIIPLVRKESPKQLSDSEKIITETTPNPDTTRKKTEIEFSDIERLFIFKHF